MKFWIRGQQWDPVKADRLTEFPIEVDKFRANELILTHQLRAEGYPSPWGQALSFAARLRDHTGDTKGAYKETCARAALDFVTLVVSQFLGHLVPKALPWRGGDAVISSRFGELLHGTLADEGLANDHLVVLRDVGLQGEPIAAINHPVCLFFPVQSYGSGALEQLRHRIGQSLGRLHLEGIDLSDPNPSTHVKDQIAQLRGYLQELAPADGRERWRRILQVFNAGVGRIDSQTIEPPVRAGEAHVRVDRLGRAVGPRQEEVVGLALRSFGDISDYEIKWANRAYDPPPMVLQGGANPQTHVYDPAKRDTRVEGWDHLTEQGLYFDRASGSYVIWDDDSPDLMLPPNAIRVSVRRGRRGADGEALFRINRAEITVRGEVMSRSEVLIPEVLEVNTPEASAQPLPIRGEEARAVDWEAGGLRADPAHPGRWNAHLRGGWVPFDWPQTGTSPYVPDSNIGTPDNVALLLWPGFESKDWYADTLVYNLIRQRTEEPPIIRCYWRTREGKRHISELTGLAITSSVLHLDGKVEALEWTTPEGTPLGYFRPQRQQILPNPHGTKAYLAIDFGTSNTVVAWSLTSDPKNVREVNFDRNPDAQTYFEPLAVLAPGDPKACGRVARGISLLPFWPQRKEPQWYVPSEILPYVSGEAEYWTIPHEAIKGNDIVRVRSDFKWQDEERKYRYRYLEMVLRMALANLRGQGIKTVNLRATYPLAFENTNINSYNEVVRDLVEDMHSKTGMTLRFQGYASESIAGLQACDKQHGNIQCMIDFGGGTTDIAVRALGIEKEQPLFVDSIRLAGNDVLTSLLADDALQKEILALDGFEAKHKTTEGEKIARQRVLRDLRGSRRGAMPGFWANISSQNSGAAERFASRNRAFFDGILAYVLVLLAEAEQRVRKADPQAPAPNVAIFLLGQGWGLLRLRRGRGQFEPVKYVEQRIEQLRGAMPKWRGSYDTPHVISPGEEVKYQPKLATSFGALQLETEDLISAEEILGTTGRSTVFGANVEFFNGTKVTAGEMIEQQRNPVAEPQIRSHDAWESFIEPLLEFGETADHVRQLFGPDPATRKRNVEQAFNARVPKRLSKQFREGSSLQESAIGILLEDIWARRLRRAEPE